MQQLDEIVIFYLGTETNYALLISGEWGVGKTYYYNYIIKKLISETPTKVNYQKKYKPILISLFGLKSLEEIQSEIFLSLYPTLKNKAIKLGANVGKSLIKGITKLTGLGDYNDYVLEVEFEKGDWIEFSELVICFDDLERLSENLNIEEFIGYINSLVENENVKIILIANENKINKEKYFTLKEKVVGNTIEFIPDFKISYESLVTLKFAGSPTYKAFLEENRDFVIEIFEKKSINLRVLTFALTYFQTIYSYFIKDVPQQDILKDKEVEILKKLLKFSITISIDYREGTLSFQNSKGLDTIKEFSLQNHILDSPGLGTHDVEKKEVEPSYKEKFIQQYYKDDEFHFFPSIYRFITGGSIFNLDVLLQELRAIYYIEGNQVLPQYEIYKQLSYPNVWALSEMEYKQSTKQMLLYSDNGSYDILKYLTVFDFASRFGNPLKYNLDKLERRIIRGMQKGKPNYNYIDSLGYYLGVDSTSEHKEHLIKLKEAAIILNEEIYHENQKLENLSLEKLCYDDFNAFFTKVINHHNPYSRKPIFKSFNINKFFKFYLNSKNDTRWQIVRFFGSRYAKHPSAYLKPDIPFLEKFKQKLDFKNDRIPKHGITYFVSTELYKVLQKSIDYLHDVS